MLNDEAHWNRFYTNWNLSVPSQFCVMTAVDLPPGGGLVEFGCGNGRDAASFAMYGAKVLAFDASEEAVAKAADLASVHQGLNLKFKCCDVADASVIVSTVEAWRTEQPILFYARFFLHSIDEERENSVLGAVKQMMRHGDRGYLEFRTSGDAEGFKEFGQHYRRYIDFNTFCSKLGVMGFKVEYRVEGKGMAVFRGEDATVGRVVFALP